MEKVMQDKKWDKNKNSVFLSKILTQLKNICFDTVSY